MQIGKKRKCRREQAMGNSFFLNYAHFQHGIFFGRRNAWRTIAVIEVDEKCISTQIYLRCAYKSRSMLNFQCLMLMHHTHHSWIVIFIFNFDVNPTKSLFSKIIFHSKEQYNFLISLALVMWRSFVWAVALCERRTEWMNRSEARCMSTIWKFKRKIEEIFNRHNM